MKKWMKYMLMSVLLITVLLSHTVSAKDSGTAILKKAEGSNNVTVSLDLAEGGTEAITSIHFTMYISLESGEMEAPSFEWASALTSDVKDAEVTFDAEANDYIIDIILSGKQDQLILDGQGDAEIGTLIVPDGTYYAEVGLVAADDALDATPVLQYVESAGMNAMSVRMTNVVPVMIGEKPAVETPEPEPTPEPTPTPTPEPEPTPGITPEPETSPEPETTPTPETSPEPETTPTPETSPEPETTPTPEITPTPEPTPETSPEPTAPPQTEPTPSEPTAPPEPEKDPTVRPDTPTLTASASLGSKKVAFQWGLIPDADGYQIYLMNNETGKFDKKLTIADGGKDSCVHKLPLGDTYTLRMRAYKLGQDGKTKVFSEYSPQIQVTVPAFDKAQKVSASASTRSGDTRVYFRWSKAEGADGYLIYRYNPTKKKYVGLAAIKNKEALSYTSSAPYKYGRTYTFMVRPYAVDADGRTKVCGAYSEPFQVKIAPAQVTGVSVRSDAAGQAMVTWRGVYGAQGYRVFRSTSPDGAYARIAMVTKGLKYTDKKVESGKTYYYKVRATNISPQGSTLLGKKSAACQVQVK